MPFSERLKTNIHKQINHENKKTYINYNNSQMLF